MPTPPPVTAADRYHHLYDWAWAKRARRHLRANPYCAECRRQGRVQFAAVADHVKPHRGDPEKFRTGELQSLCKPHHDQKTREEERPGRLRFPRSEFGRPK